MASPKKIKKIRNTLFIIGLTVALMGSIFIWVFTNETDKSESIFKDIEGLWESNKYGEILIEKKFTSSEKYIHIKMTLNGKTINDTIRAVNTTKDQTKFTLHIQSDTLTFQKVYKDDCSCYWHLLIVNNNPPEIITKKQTTP